MSREPDLELIDTHCHLDFPEFDPDRDDVIARAREKGIRYFVNVGSSLQGSEKSVSLSRQFDCVFATVGLHPHEADRCDEKALARIDALSAEKKVVAIGETGLDFFKNYASRENQVRLFSRQIELAKKRGLPLVIHSRQAQGEILGIMKERMPLKAVVHCFSGDELFLNECLDMGFFVSFTCNITYKKAGDLRALLERAPVERLMLETDAPFLSPEAFRGRRNEPMHVRLLAEEAAGIKKMRLEDLAAAATRNAKQFFGI